MHNWLNSTLISSNYLILLLRWVYLCKIHLHFYSRSNSLIFVSEKPSLCLREAFTLFDTDGDDKIAPSRLVILMRSLGGNPTQALLKSIISEEKLKSSFDFHRCLDLMSKHLKHEPFDRQLRDAFKTEPYVVVSDLRHILTSIGEKLEPTEFDEWIHEVDVGSDEIICKKKYKKGLKAADAIIKKFPDHGVSA